jgi:hypothetical protein
MPGDFPGRDSRRLQPFSPQTALAEGNHGLRPSAFLQGRGKLEDLLLGAATLQLSDEMDDFHAWASVIAIL